MTPNTLTISELDSLLATNGLPTNTPVTVRITDGTSDVIYGIARVQAVRQLHLPRALAAGQAPEFVVEIVVTRPGQPHRPSAPHGTSPLQT